MRRLRETQSALARDDLALHSASSRRSRLTPQGQFPELVTSPQPAVASPQGIRTLDPSRSGRRQASIDRYSSLRSDPGGGAGSTVNRRPPGVSGHE